MGFLIAPALVFTAGFVLREVALSSAHDPSGEPDLSAWTRTLPSSAPSSAPAKPDGPATGRPAPWALSAAPTQVAGAHRGVGQDREPSPRESTRETTSPATPPATPSAAPTSPAPDPAALEREVVELTNAERAQAGCEPLREEPRLGRAARAHSRDMAEHGELSDETSEGEPSWERAWDEGYFYYWTENLARGEPTARAVVESWMSDPEAREHIVDCGLEALGVGVHLDAAGPWWTQMFGFR